jgi:hypothetical protein
MEFSEKKDFRAFLAFGAVMGFVAALGGLSDVGLSAVLGGADISVLPKDALGRFASFRESPFVGLYRLDFLNVCISLASLPFFLALALAHFERRPALALFALSTTAIGTAVFVAGNAALPMLGLAGKYYTAADDAGRQAIAAAGEALLSRGAHGSPGAFPGFVLSSLSSLLFSILMLVGGLFSKPVAILGVAGSSIMILYLIIVTFMPGMEHVAMFIVMFGGLATLCWLVIASIRLIGLGRDRAKA